MIELIIMFGVIGILFMQILTFSKRKYVKINDYTNLLHKIVNHTAEISNQQLEIIDKIELIRVNTNNVARNTYFNKIDNNNI